MTSGTRTEFVVPKRGFLWACEVVEQLSISRSTLDLWLQHLPMIRPKAFGRQQRKRFYPRHLNLLSDVRYMRQSGMSLRAIRYDLTWRFRRSSSGRPASAPAEPEGVKRERWMLETTHKPTAAEIVRHAHVTPRTANRYLSAGSAPYAVGALTDLHVRGRVLPSTWQYCFINARGNLEIHSAGEVSETDILNMSWERNLHHAQVTRLHRELEDAKARIAELESDIEAGKPGRAREYKGATNSDNQRVRCMNLNAIHRHLELTLEGLQGIEQIARASDEGAAPVAAALVPTLFQLELYLDELRKHTTITTLPDNPGDPDRVELRLIDSSDDQEK